MSRRLPPHHLAQHPIIQRLNLGLKFPYKYEVENKMVSSGTMHSIGQDYIYIIQRILEYATTLQARENELDAQNSKLNLYLTKLSIEHQLLVSKFQQLVDSGDMEFLVQGTGIKAHSAIVSAWSTPLAIMLTSPMREGVTKCIEITDEEPEIVRTMVSFFYTGTVELSSDNALPLLRLSALYDIVSLRDKCCDYFLDRISLDNCIDLLLVSWLHEQEHTSEWEELLGVNTEFIVDNADEIVENCAEELYDIGILELSKIWPLLQDGCSCDLTGIFAQWAKIHWGAENLVECLVHIRNESENSTQDISAHHLRALTFFSEFCQLSLIRDFEAQRNNSSFGKVGHIDLISILESDELAIENESLVLDFVISWMQVGPNREEFLPRILECVRFPYISASELVKIPLLYPQIGKAKRFGSLLQEALHFQLQSVTNNNIALSNPRIKRRGHAKYQVPQIDALDFVTFISAGVLQLTKNPREDELPVAEPVQRDVNATRNYGRQPLQFRGNIARGIFARDWSS